MKKIAILSLVIFLFTTFNLNAQELNFQSNFEYSYDKENNIKSFRILNLITEKNSKNLSQNQTKFDIQNLKSNKSFKEKQKFSKKIKYHTVGNYIGLDFVKTSLRYKDIGYNPQIISNYSLPKYKNSIGLKYLYSINYLGFFLAPELFFEYNNIKKNFDGDNYNKGLNNERLYENHGYKFMKIHRIYGGKINFGYDITPIFSPFLFAGLSRIYYSNLNSVYPLNTYNPDFPNDFFATRYDVIKKTGKDPFSIIHKSRNVPFFGFGSKIKLSTHFLFNFEYLIYKNFISKTNGFKNFEFNNPSEINDYVEFENKLRVIKFGLLYNF